MSSSKPSASVIVAGVVAILGSALAIFISALGLIGTALISSTPIRENLPAPAKSVAMVTLLFFMAVAGFGIFTGVGLFRLKSWARISALVWAGIIAFFSALILLFLPFIPLPETSTGQSVPAAHLKVLMYLAYGILLVVGIWWLILFTRPGIRAQFSGEAPPNQPQAPERPRCPLPVAAIGGFFVFSFLFTFAFPLLHMPLPVILFGHRLNGTLGPGVFALTATLLLAGGLGLLKLKRWSYPLVLGVQFFWLASSTVTFLSSSYERNMQQVLEEMHLPQPNTVSQMYLDNRPLALAGLLPSILIIVILLYYRERFLTAAKAAETIGGG
jgi:hypothetical protein